MKQAMTLISVLVLAACGGKRPGAEEPKEPAESEEVEPEPAAAATAAGEKAPAPEPEPAPAPPPPPPPKSWRAQAALTPVRGSRIKAATVTFAQQEGQPVTIASSGGFAGIRAGKYHLVVHQAAACGPNASKAGKAMAGASVGFTAAKGMDALEVTGSEVMQLAGDAAIVGHTLVLHDDKRGKPGRSLACGPIAAADE